MKQSNRNQNYLSQTNPLYRLQNKTMVQSLGKGVLYFMCSEIVFILSNYLIHLLLARYLGVEAYGLFGVLMSLYLINRSFLQTGFPKAVSRLLAQSFSTTVMKEIVRFQWKMALLFAAGFILFSPVIAFLLQDTALLPYLLFLGALIIPLAFQSLFTSGFLNGLRMFREQAIIKAVFPLCRLVFTIFFVVIGFGLYGALFALFLASFVGIFGVRRFIERRLVLPTEVKPGVRHLDGSWKKNILAFAFPLTISAFIFALVRNVNVLFLKGMESNTAAGLYTAALTLSNLPYLLFTALPLVLFPSISKAAHEGNRKLIRKYVWQSLRYGMLLLLPLSAIMAANALPLLKLFYGPAYVAAANTLVILIISSVFLSLFGIFTSVLSACGKPKMEMLLALLFLVLMSFLNFFLIPSQGAVGAAWSSLVASGTAVLVAAFFIIMYSGIFFSWVSVFRIIFASFFIFALGYVFPSSGVQFIFSSVGLLLIYLAVLGILGEIRREDWLLLRKIFKRNLLPPPSVRSKKNKNRNGRYDNNQRNP